MVFCITNYEDKNGFLHNGYQILYIGDLNASYKGWLKAEQLNKQRIMVTIPAVSSSFTKANELTIDQLTSNVVAAVRNSYVTGASNVVADKDLQLFDVVVDFSRTGKQLTNKVFSPKLSSYKSAIWPAPARVDTVLISKLAKDKKQKVEMAEMYCGFNIARVEPVPRCATIKKDNETSDNLVAAAFAGTLDDDDHSMG